MRLLLVIAVMMGTLPAARAADDAIGRIFFTPAQRAQLNLARSQKIVATQAKDEPIPELVTYNGIVRRTDGKATVWVNNRAMSDAELSAAQPLAGRIDRSGQILLQAPQGAGSLQLKVGQSAELLSGRVDEAYAVQKKVTVQKPVATPAIKPETKPAAETPPGRPRDDVRPAAEGPDSSRERNGNTVAK